MKPIHDHTTAGIVQLRIDSYFTMVYKGEVMYLCVHMRWLKGALAVRQPLPLQQQFQGKPVQNHTAAGIGQLGIDSFFIT